MDRQLHIILELYKTLINMRITFIQNWFALTFLNIKDDALQEFFSEFVKLFRQIYPNFTGPQKRCFAQVAEHFNINAHAQTGGMESSGDEAEEEVTEQSIVAADSQEVEVIDVSSLNQNNQHVIDSVKDLIVKLFDTGTTEESIAQMQARMTQTEKEIAEFIEEMAKIDKEVQGQIDQELADYIGKMKKDYEARKSSKYRWSAGSSLWGGAGTGMGMVALNSILTSINGGLYRMFGFGKMNAEKFASWWVDYMAKWGIGDGFDHSPCYDTYFAPGESNNWRVSVQGYHGVPWVYSAGQEGGWGCTPTAAKAAGWVKGEMTNHLLGACVVTPEHRLSLASTGEQYAQCVPFNECVGPSDEVFSNQTILMCAAFAAFIGAGIGWQARRWLGNEMLYNDLSATNKAVKTTIGSGVIIPAPTIVVTLPMAISLLADILIFRSKEYDEIYQAYHYEKVKYEESKALFGTTIKYETSRANADRLYKLRTKTHENLNELKKRLKEKNDNLKLMNASYQKLNEDYLKNKEMMHHTTEVVLDRATQHLAINTTSMIAAAQNENEKTIIGLFAKALEDRDHLAMEKILIMQRTHVETGASMLKALTQFTSTVDATISGATMIEGNTTQPALPSSIEPTGPEE